MLEQAAYIQSFIKSSTSLLHVSEMDFESDDVSQKPKRKRVLPQWMLDAGKPQTNSAESEKKKEEKPVLYVMSPYELEEYARQVLAE